MPQYVVFKMATNGAAPAVGTAGSADVYLGDHATEAEATAAAATLWKPPPSTFLYAELASALTRYVMPAYVPVLG